MTQFSFLQAAAGPFIGAGLAFFSNGIFQARRDAKGDLAAGNLALFALVTMESELHTVRTHYRSSLAEQRFDFGGLKPNRTPFWLPPKPARFEFTPDAEIDISTLSFLTDERPGRDTLIGCRAAQQTFASARLHFDELQELSRTVLDLLDAGELEEIRGGPPADSGVDRNMRNRSYELLLDTLVAIDVALHCIGVAGRELHFVMDRRFGKLVWRLEFLPAEEKNNGMSELPPAHHGNVGPRVAQAIANNSLSPWMDNPPAVRWWTFAWRKLISF